MVWQGRVGDHSPYADLGPTLKCPTKTYSMKLSIQPLSPTVIADISLSSPFWDAYFAVENVRALRVHERERDLFEGIGI